MLYSHYEEVIMSSFFYHCQQKQCKSDRDALVVFYSDENHLTINPLSKPITLSQPPPVILVCDLF